MKAFVQNIDDVTVKNGEFCPVLYTDRRAWSKQTPSIEEGSS
ncbi:MAG: hypothetical protein ABI621_09040 [Chloroflexota bacterium]